MGRARFALLAVIVFAAVPIGAGCSSASPGWTGGPGGGTGPGGGGNGGGPGGFLGGGNNNNGGGTDGGGGGPTVDAGSGGGHDAGLPPPGTDAGNPPPPVDAAPPPPVDSGQPMDGFDQFQHHNLDVVNMYRATLGVAPLVLDQQLCTFAIGGSQELSIDHLPHQHFINASNDGSIWSDGFNGSAAENQGDPNGWPQASSDPVQNELMQIDQIQQAMFNEGPGAGEAHGHYTNMMNSQYTRLGVGLLEVGGMLYLTNDFSP